MGSKQRDLNDDYPELRFIMILLGSAVFAAAASTRSMDSLLPMVAKFYGQSVGTTGLSVGAYAISYSSCQLIYGPLGDRVGPYRLITLAAMLSALAAIGCALAPSFEWLVAMRFLAGGIAAGIGALTLAWVSHATRPEQRAVAVANITGSSIIGTSAGQVGGGLIGQLFNWQSTFLVIAALFLVSGVMLALDGFRRPGLRLVGRMASQDDGAARVDFLRLIKRPEVNRVLAAVGLEGLAMYTSFTYIAALLESRLVLGMAVIGLLIALFGVGGVTFVLLARPLVRRLSESRRAAWGGGLIGAGFMLLVLAHSSWISGFALYALGFGFFMLHNTLQVRATHMAPDAPAAGLCLFAATFFLAQALGALIGGWFFDHLGASLCFCFSAAVLTGLGLSMGRLPARSAEPR